MRPVESRAPVDPGTGQILLRLGAVEEVAMSAPTRSLLCRTNLHHHWEVARTPDGTRYERCARCLKERRDGISPGTNAGMGIGGGVSP
jgi:hypothetical protein